MLMSKSFLKDRDVLPGILTAALGAWLCWQGLGMPRPRGWTSAPGLSPIIVGVGLVLMAAVLLLKTRSRHVAARIAASDSSSVLEAKMEEAAGVHEVTRDEFRKTLGITALIGFYILGLRFLPFDVVTALFVMGGMWVFGERSPWKLVTIGILVPLVIGVLFILVLETLLPGNGSLIESIFYG